MLALARPWGTLHVRDTGPRDAPAVLLLNALGTDLRLWDAVAVRLPGLRLVALDKRGHGLSSTPEGDWDVADLADDALAVLDHLGIARAVVAGCSIGGLIAQALALRAPDRVAALLLACSAARLGTPDAWAERAAAVRAGGMAAIVPTVLARWFPPAFRTTPEARLWETMLHRADPRGYAATCGALARADLRGEVGRIACPTLALAGGADVGTPPDLVAATVDLIPGARLAVLDGSGHLPMADAPGAVARHLAALVEEAHA